MRGQRLVAALMTALLAGCGQAVATTDPVPAGVRPAPDRQYAVGMRQFTLDPEGARPLPVTVWYPADLPTQATPSASTDPAGQARATAQTLATKPDRTTASGSAALPGSAPARDAALSPGPAATSTGPAAGPSGTGTLDGPRVRPGAPFAAGRFPVVLYSHGLRSLPALHAALTSRWAAAGFVVVAPTYPRTSLRARSYTRDDVRNQPADAWRLVRHLVRLGTRPGDPLGAHLAVDRFAAAGHSAGGHTSLGMFASGQPTPLRAGIVIAGGRMVAGFSRPLAPMLFVHGSADRIVPESIGRAAYARCLGPAAFLSLRGQGHGEYLTPGRAGFPQVLATTTDFLRWTLYADRAALRRLPADATSPGTTFTTHSLPT
ncbi:MULTISPECIES: chlorophyllase/cutinase-like alpha/beta fold protein [unclassified Micromonospora]|uniref:alpha/beta hydrolase family protein n=1 Tax=unclassified Micromonospora TaxID=2617518 RepID=UPI0003EEC96B|nr:MULTISPECIES: alpha/beta hydrolase [unclassified Micromonospora]EWM67732.1 basic proline-rich protein [Micromonospora sp. M42]MCK1809813.1 alpha/beta hydrolase [Micromonospora sp. R42106]MCK1835629.1 alpha/beta hydrolase [Micromonospora sp. R42003]MCK1846830.1 alpha/beta hydrolase [Micromonospora sp. R42004]MCM1019052.1 alpha/beta hydrolase [Micromonospora sp. XM-20-01]